MKKMMMMKKKNSLMMKRGIKIKKILKKKIIGEKKFRKGVVKTV
jgi:hypothetical protein